MTDDPFSSPPAVPPPVTPPPPGTPPPGGLGSKGADGWRWYYALFAFFGGLVVSQIAVLIIAAIWAGAGSKDFTQLQDDPVFILVASAVNELFFIATAVFVARLSGSFAWRDLGLVRTRFWRTVGLTGAFLVSYYVLLLVFNQLVHLAPDDAPEKLGANAGNMRMLFFALLVAVLAPIAEEIFFRGMIFRALRNGTGLWPAAIISGLLFGALHIDATTTDRLLQVAALTVFGIFLALLYSWTGTLYATIAMHATNNALAVAAFAEKHNSDFGLILAGVLWLLMMVGCAFGHRLTDRRADAPPGGISGSGDGQVEYALPR